NTASYYAGGGISKSPSGATGPTSHTFNLNTANFTVTGSSAETITPVLDAFSMTGSPATAGSAITVSYSATEASGFLQGIYFYYTDQLGGGRYISSGSNIPLTGTISQIIPANWPNGTYTLASISL